MAVELKAATLVGLMALGLSALFGLMIIRLKTASPIGLKVVLLKEAAVLIELNSMVLKAATQVGLMVVRLSALVGLMFIRV